MKNNFPKQLTREDYFKCPIWHAEEPSFVKSLNKASDKYIKESKKNSRRNPWEFNILSYIRNNYCWETCRY